MVDYLEGKGIKYGGKNTIVNVQVKALMILTDKQVNEL